MTHEKDTTFRLTIGPAGLRRGYAALTGLYVHTVLDFPCGLNLHFHLGIPGWGIAWYVNGILIPELRLRRGSTYTFIIEGGDDPSNLADYHPFYITSSEIGGKLRFANQV